MASFQFQPARIGPALTGELVVVMPIYNEVSNIAQVVVEWQAVFQRLGIRYQVLLINDGSKDATFEVLTRLETEHPDTLVVVDKFNSGHGRSCRFGYDAAVASNAEWILQLDSDGQCDPAFFEEFWARRSNADCVFGRRIQRDDGMARSLTSKLCRFGATLLGGRDMVDPNVPYRLMRREILAESLKRIPASFNIHNVAVTFILKKTAGTRWEYVPIRFRDRQGGSNSIDLLNVAQWGVDMLLELRRLR